jgi:hypothetical protein
MGFRYAGGSLKYSVSTFFRSDFYFCTKGKTGSSFIGAWPLELLITAWHRKFMVIGLNIVTVAVGQVPVDILLLIASARPEKECYVIASFVFCHVHAHSSSSSYITYMYKSLLGSAGEHKLCHNFIIHHHHHHHLLQHDRFQLMR